MDMDLKAQILHAHEVRQQRLRKYIILIVALVSALFTAVSPPILQGGSNLKVPNTGW